MSQDVTSPVSPVVTLSRITKRYPGVIANNRIDLTLWPGEVHVLLGENGAGKSTLVAMLSGLQQPDEGTIAVDGRAVVLSSPRRARALGIGTVYQQLMMAPSLSIVDNIALGDPWWRPPARRAYAARIGEIARDIGVTVNPNAQAGSLSLGELQQAEIVRTLLRGSRVLILDEATAMLTPQSAHDLGLLMRRLVAQGLAVVFITHKLNEALDWGDRISILRLGHKVGEIDPARLKSLNRHQVTREVLGMMFNLDAALEAPPSVNLPAPITPFGVSMLQVQGLAVNDALSPLSGIDFNIRAGEILGIAGIDGNGQKQLAEALAGQRPLASGQIYLAGERITHCSIGQRRRRGLRYVTDDRLGEGAVGAFGVATNLLLKQIGASPFWRRGIVRPAAITRHAQALVRDYDIRTPRIDTPLGTLSGGNIQKTLLARELNGRAKAVIFAKPTQGLDVQNTQSIREEIRRCAREGMGILLISTDLEEILALADRVAVMSAGKIAGIVDNYSHAGASTGSADGPSAESAAGAAVRRSIGELMSGVTP